MPRYFADARRAACWPTAIALTVAILSGCGSEHAVENGNRVNAAGAESRQGPSIKSALSTIHRFVNVRNGAYFYTGNGAEKDLLLSGAFPDFRHEGPVFQSAADGTGIPVYRFANTRTGGYFYTANEAERELVVSDPAYAHFRFEGVGFRAASNGGAGTEPVYRLASLVNGAYLYTASSEERALVVAAGPWRDEGVGFHVPLASAAGDCLATTFQTLGFYNPVGPLDFTASDGSMWRATDDAVPLWEAWLQHGQVPSQVCSTNTTPSVLHYVGQTYVVYRR